MKVWNQKDRNLHNSERAFRRGIAAAVCAILSSGLILGGCGKKEEAVEKSTDIMVDVKVPEKENIELEGQFIGTVEADTEVHVVPKVAGEVTAVYFEEGDVVQAGDLLFTVDDTSAQITMTQAKASLQSAQASVASAQAGEQAAQFGLLYTQAQIEETMGTVDTNQMQLENAVASAKYSLKAAEENKSISTQQFENAKDNYKDLEDSLDDLRDNADQMGKYADSLKKYKKVYDSVKSASDGTEAETLLSGYGVGLGELGVSNSDTPQVIADAYINKMTDAGSEYELGVMISSAESTESSLRSSRSSADSNKDNLLLNQISSAINIEISKNNVLQAEDAKRLAEKMLADYENYTKATILAGANASLANSNSSVAQAQAGVTQAQAGVTQAQASVDAAQLQLDYTRVTSPVNGVITQKNVTLHNMASSGSSAYVIASEDGVNVTFFVSEKVMKALSEGQQVKVERNGEFYDAVVSENAGVADAESGLFKVKATIGKNGGSLITGTSVKVTLATERAENVMTIPVDSVYYESETAYVYCMQDGKAVKTMVETGVTNNETVEIKSGLTQDSKVITSWAAQLKDGAGVALRDEWKEDGGTDSSSEEEPVSDQDAKTDEDAKTGADSRTDADQDIYATAGAALAEEVAMMQP